MTYEVWKPRHYPDMVSSTSANTFDPHVRFAIGFLLGYPMSESHVFLASLAGLGAVFPKSPAPVSDYGQPQVPDGHSSHPQEHRAAH